MDFFKLTFKSMMHIKYVVVGVALFFLAAGLDISIEVGIEIYCGLLGILIFGELLVHEGSYKTELFVKSIHNAKTKLLFSRMSIATIFIVIFTIMLYLFFILLGQEIYSWHTVTIEFIISGVITAVFFGLATLLVAVITRNYLAGFLVMLSYWMLWVTMFRKYPDSILNPFRFAVFDDSGVLELKIYLLIFIAIMLVSLRYISKK